MLQGFGLAALVAIPLGLAIGWSRFAARVIDPTVQLLRPVPITAWLPFAIAVFGIYDASALFLIGLGAFYPIVVNTTHGVRDTNLLLLRAARMMGAGAGSVMAKVVFPSALPSIFTGLRLGIGVAWTAVIVAEMIAVKSGLGYVLWDAYYVGRMDICVATMFSVGLLGFLSDRVIVLARRASCCAGARSRRTHDRDRGRLARVREGRAQRHRAAGHRHGGARRRVRRAARPLGLRQVDAAQHGGGLRLPTGGSVKVAGEAIRAPSPQRGVVFQEPALFPWFSVMDNVVFGPKTRGDTPADYKPRAAQILEQVGLRGFEDAYPAELSGGMRQRVGIARVLMLESRSC